MGGKERAQKYCKSAAYGSGSEEERQQQAERTTSITSRTGQKTAAQRAWLNGARPPQPRLAGSFSQCGIRSGVARSASVLHSTAPTSQQTCALSP
ncbi:hypothetical protein MRX96_006619 [Rhipicephalus microplus]